MATAPHYYVTVEVDMAAAAKFRAEYPIKLSYNDLVMRAAGLALLEWPQVNARWLGDAVEEAGEINFEKHPDAKLVIEELKQTASAYRARVEAERAAGNTPHSCLPEGEVDLSTDALIPFLKSYDASASAALPLSQAFAELMVQTYPCG